MLNYTLNSVEQSGLVKSLEYCNQKQPLIIDLLLEKICPTIGLFKNYYLLAHAIEDLASLHR